MNKLSKKALIGVILVFLLANILSLFLFFLPRYEKAKIPDRFLTPLPTKPLHKTITAQAYLPLPNPLSPNGSVLAANTKKEVIGFLPFWLLNENYQVPFDKLTQIAYFGLEVNDKGEFVKILDDGTIEPGYNKMGSDIFTSLQALAQKNNVKLLLTLRLMHTRPIEALLNNLDAQDLLINNTSRVVKDHNLSGVNIDFEYEGTPPDKTVKSFTRFSKNLTERIHNDINNSVISVSVYSDSAYKTRLTEIWPLSQVVDQIIIMGYDFFRPSSDTAGPIAPLTGSGQKYEYDLTKTLADFIKLSSPEKIILGLPFYGYDWPVIDDKPYGFSLDTGALSSYSRTKKLLQEKGLTSKWDDLSQTPFFTYQDKDSGLFRQIYFDDPKSLSLKLALINHQNLGGLAIWALGYEGENQDYWEVIENTLINNK